MKNGRKLVALVMAILMVLSLATVASAETAKTAKIGILQYVEHNALDASAQGFKDVLMEAGYAEDCFTYQNASGDNATLQLMAEDFAEGYDLVLAVATPAVQLMSSVTDTTPILGTAVTDYVSANLVMSNEKPGANVSGTTDMNPIKEQIDLLMQLAPETKTIGIAYTSSEVNSEVQANAAIEYIETLGLAYEVKTITAVGDLQQVMESLVGKVDALYLPTDNIIASAMEIVGQIAGPAKIPAICGESNMVAVGGLATYGIDYYELGRQTGMMALEILENGANVSEMPIESLENLSIYLNQAVADEIGVVFPEDLVANAAEIYPLAEEAAAAE